MAFTTAFTPENTALGGTVQRWNGIVRPACGIVRPARGI